jgi:ABC-2 type transport system ATP-binding protein
MLQIIGLRKAYGAHQVLCDVDLTATAGQVVGLLGANGAGKTTLISIVAGLRRADAGHVRLCGIDALRHPRRAAEHLGLAPQELGLYPTLTVADNLLLFGRLAGLRGPAARRNILTIAERLGLEAQLGQRAGELSGGQKRRLHTGLAVLHRPQVLFLDEPTVGADVPSRAGILDLVRELAAEGAAVVYTTHYLTELEQLGADIAVLHEGRIAVRGPLAEVVNAWASASVALRFTGPPPMLTGWRIEGFSLVPREPVTDPGTAAASALADLGDRASGLAGVEVTPASLESAYLAITGRPLTPEDTHALAA